MRHLCLWLLALTVLLPLQALPPAWWSSSPQVLDSSATADDYVVANQGQAKNVATKARTYLLATLPAPPNQAAIDSQTALDNMVNGWATPTSLTDDYAALNLGQLKTVAQPFYNCMNAAGYPVSTPWTADPADGDDYSLVNLGQLKNVFSFSIPVPATPQNLTATASNQQAVLTWSAVPLATSYVLQRSTTSGGPYTDFANNSTTATTLTNTGLINGTTYYYVVKAVNATGPSPASPSVSATPTAPLVSIPASLSAVLETGRVLLSWNPSTGNPTITYRVRRSTSSGSGYVDFPGNTTTGASLQDTLQSGGSVFYYVVTGSNALGSSDNSNEITVTIPSGVGPDSDSDGLSDEWENFYFGNLNQTGSGDFDSDGLNNVFEYQTNQNPILSNADANDHTPPVITLTKPVDAVLIP